MGLAEFFPFQRCRHDVVAILENVRFDRQVVAGDAPDHVAPAVDERLHILDNSSGKGPGHGPSIN